MSVKVRLLISAIVSFCFYFGWAYWANANATDDPMLLWRIAFVQGSYSALVTTMFTFALEWTFTQICQSKPALLMVVPLPALTLQSLLVVGINIVNQTPNLWLTVAPSIFFTGVYGYFYVLFVLRRQYRQKQQA